MRRFLYMGILAAILLAQNPVSADTGRTVVQMSISDQTEAMLLLPFSEIELVWEGEMPLVSIESDNEYLISDMAVTPHGNLVLVRGEVQKMSFASIYEVSIF